MRNQRTTRTVSLTMRMFAAALLCALLAACASPTAFRSVPPEASPTAALAPATPSPVPSPAIALTYLGHELGAQSPALSSGCQHEGAAVLQSVARLGYSVGSVTIGFFDFRCGGPFAMGARSCPLMVAASGGAAYVTFVGTPKVASLTFAAVDDPPFTATVVAFEVPPPGWAGP